jgi:hypothetical protein
MFASGYGAYNDSTGMYSGYLRSLQRGDVDVLVGDISATVNRMRTFDFLHPIVYVCQMHSCYSTHVSGRMHERFTFAVPEQLPRSAFEQPLIFVHMFSWPVWICIALLAIFMAALAFGSRRSLSWLAAVDWMVRIGNRVRFGKIIQF